MNWFETFPMLGLHVILTRLFLGKNENHHEQKTKPRYRTVPKFPKPFQTNMPGVVGVVGNTTGLQHQTLKTLRTEC